MTTDNRFCCTTSFYCRVEKVLISQASIFLPVASSDLAWQTADNVRIMQAALIKYFSTAIFKCWFKDYPYGLVVSYFVHFTLCSIMWFYLILPEKEHNASLLCLTKNCKRNRFNNLVINIVQFLSNFHFGMRKRPIVNK